MKKLVMLFVTICITLSLVGCTSEPKQEDANENSKNFKVALITDPIGAEQFILQAYDEVMALAKTHGFDAVSIECADTAAWSEKSRNASVEGYNLIIGVGWQAAEPFSELAEEFPEIKYAVIDTVAKNEKVMSIAFNTADGSYVLGALVAGAFPSETLYGYIGNFQNQSNFEYRYGFMEGVKSVNPDAEFMINFTDSYSDTSVAYNLAKQQAAAGCTFIMGSVASSANQGIYQAALDLAKENKPIYTTGLSVDQTTKDNPYIVGGLTKDTAVATRTIVDTFISGNFSGGKQIIGFKEKAFRVVNINTDSVNYWNTDIMNEQAMEAGKKAAQDIIDGTVTINVPME